MERGVARNGLHIDINVALENEQLNSLGITNKKRAAIKIVLPLKRKVAEWERTLCARRRE